VTVLDFGQVYNGPYCGFLLAQAGARVIKVESPQGETLRGRARATSASYPFALLNGNKQCITLNIKTTAGQALLKRLAARVDVVFENFAPGTLDKYGIGAAGLRAANPRLVYASSTGYGRTGPNRDFLGMDITIQAMTGVMSVTGEEGGPPMKAGAALADFFGGVHLYAGIVSALYRRSQTGVGAVIDISMQDTVFPALATALGAYFHAGGEYARSGNRHPARSAAPYNVYRARDGHVAMICIREGHWQGLCAAMGSPELANEGRFADMASRCANMDELDATIEAWTSTLGRDEIFRVCQAHHVICAPVATLADVVADPHLHARGTLEWTDHPTLGPIVLCHTALRYEGEAPPVLTPVRDLGADTAAVLADLIGVDEAELAALAAAGAL
jgi:crotonobetainyl-CoA:carnitine CoA-transferase CaiB-like acyl-CoA transferase